MKLLLHPQARKIEISAENTTDHFKMGRLAEKLGTKAHTYSANADTRTLEVSIDDLLELILK